MSDAQRSVIHEIRNQINENLQSLFAECERLAASLDAVDANYQALAEQNHNLRNALTADVLDLYAERDRLAWENEQLKTELKLVQQGMIAAIEAHGEGCPWRMSEKMSKEIR